MTDLKRVPVKDKDEVSYLWVHSQRRPKKRGAPALRAADRAADPLSAPWGDIVETPLRVLRRLFNLG
jgi:hypothetical protein